MGWEPNKESFLKMMQTNKDIFGKEILEIEGASEKFLIDYFERRLAGLLEWTETVNSKYFDVKSSGKGDIESIALKPEGFGLKMIRCIQIFDYIYGKVSWDKHFKTCGLNWADSKIVMNFISKGWPLQRGVYSLEYKNSGMSWLIK